MARVDYQFKVVVLECIEIDTIWPRPVLDELWAIGFNLLLDTGDQRWDLIEVGVVESKCLSHLTVGHARQIAQALIR